MKTESEVNKMKLTDLANSYLEFMIKSYSENHVKTFSWTTLKSVHPNEDDVFICDAFRLLNADGLVNNSWADNKVYRTELRVIAIRDAEENTKLKKTYTILKEIREWL